MLNPKIRCSCNNEAASQMQRRLRRLRVEEGVFEQTKPSTTRRIASPAARPACQAGRSACHTSRRQGDDRPKIVNFVFEGLQETNFDFEVVEKTKSDCQPARPACRAGRVGWQLCLQEASFEKSRTSRRTHSTQKLMKLQQSKRRGGLSRPQFPFFCQAGLPGRRGGCQAGSQAG